MVALYVIIPIMVLAVTIAVIPVLLGSFRHNREMREGRLETTESAEHEREFWRRMLGRTRGPGVVATPDLVSDDEVIRVAAHPDRRIDVGGDSAWTPPDDAARRHR